MKKNIRKGVFETNSSSTHSICVAKEMKLIMPKNLHFYFGEFGWEHDTLSSVHEKACYLWTGLIYNNMFEQGMKIVEFLSDKGIDVTFESPIYEDRSYTNSKGELIEYTNCTNGGFIDHGTELKGFLKDLCADYDKLEQYLFSPLSFIITGNDNCDHDVSLNADYPHNEYYKGN